MMFSKFSAMKALMVLKLSCSHFDFAADNIVYSNWLSMARAGVMSLAYYEPTVCWQPIVHYPDSAMGPSPHESTSCDSQHDAQSWRRLCHSQKGKVSNCYLVTVTEVTLSWPWTDQRSRLLESLLSTLFSPSSIFSRPLVTKEASKCSLVRLILCYPSSLTFFRINKCDPWNARIETWGSGENETTQSSCSGWGRSSSPFLTI